MHLLHTSFQQDLAMATQAIKILSVQELCGLLCPKGISEDVAENFQEHGIDGETFLLMSDDELKEVAPRMADRMKLKKCR